jgi:hypothetical protein
MPPKIDIFLKNLSKNRPVPSKEEIQIIKSCIHARNRIKMRTLISENLHPLICNIVGPYVQKTVLTIETHRLLYKHLRQKYRDKYKEQKVDEE